MELENIILSEVSQAQKAKNRLFFNPSYADYSPKTNAVILDMGHINGRMHTGGIEKKT
jgi:hypothetical protein